MCEYYIKKINVCTCVKTTPPGWGVFFLSIRFLTVFKPCNNFLFANRSTYIAFFLSSPNYKSRMSKGGEGIRHFHKDETTISKARSHRIPPPPPTHTREKQKHMLYSTVSSLVLLLTNIKKIFVKWSNATIHIHIDIKIFTEAFSRRQQQQRVTCVCW